jgi:hypothetical protein
VSGLGTCRDCNQWVYWADYAGDDGRTRHVPFDEPGFFTMHWETCPSAERISINGQRLKVERCKKCRHRVYWETTPKGKKRPMDTYQDEDTGGWVADGFCHFDTCVGARTTAGSERAHKARPEPAPEYQTVGELARKVRLFGPDLGLAWPCTRQDVVSAFRRLALQHHPDMGGQADAFMRVKRAYDALKELVPA